MVGIVKPKSRRLSRTWATVILLVVCSWVWLVVTITSDWPIAYFLVWLLLVVAAFPLFRAYARGRLDLFEPITGICVMYVVYFGVAAVHQLNTPFKEGRLSINIEDGVEVALLYAVLALVALQVGYGVAGRAVRSVGWPAPVRRERWGRVFWVAVGVYATGLGARVYGVYRGFHIRFAASQTYGQFSGVDILYDYLGFLSTLGFILMAAYSFVAPRQLAARVLAWGAMLPIEVFFAFLGGPKEYFVPLLIAPLICYHYGRRAVSVSKALIPASLLGLVVFPVMTSYRLLDPSYLRRVSLWDGVNYAIGGIWDVVSQFRLLEYAWWGLELVLERLDGIYTLTGVLLNVPDTLEYQWGKTITIGLWLLIPTFIWEGKYDYLVTVINWGEQIFGVPAGGGGISITQPGELFLNFGTPGVLFGMFLLGATFRVLHRTLVGHRRFFGIVIYAILWPIIVIPEYPIAAYYSNGLKQSAIVWLVSLLAGSQWSRPRKRAVEASS